MMTTRRQAVGLALSLSAWGWGPLARAQAPAPATASAPQRPPSDTQSVESRKVAEGVYFAYETAANGAGSNSVVVVGDREALVVDTRMTRAAATALLAGVKEVAGDKPLKWAVNTHHHYDHSNGNQVFRDAGVDVIGHEFVKYAIDNHDLQHREPYLTSMVDRRIASVNKALAEEADPQKRALLEARLAMSIRQQEDMRALKPTSPNLTYRDRQVIDLGNREVQLLFLGRGHTHGDTIVYLPKEKIVCVGDLVGSEPPFLGDGQFDEWIATLERLKQLDFDLMLMGHGRPSTDGRALITGLQAYLRDVVKLVDDARRQGVGARDLAPRLDLSAHAGTFPSLKRPGLGLRDVHRVYEWLYEQGRR